MSTRGPGPIPNRWLHCPRKSDSVIAERFLAFKTPLSMAFKDQMPLDCVFTPEMIFGYIKTLKLKLGLWVDLTNTKRFYDREVVETQGAQYIKLQCRGHGETPSAEQTRSFIEFVENFVNERPFDIIGVHCTHGFNRTGFLIVSYLVERLDCSVEAALTMFAAARPPGIYKQDYINELFRRYGDEEDAKPAPDLPDWCLEYDDSNGSGTSGAAAAFGHKRQYDEAHTSTSAAARGFQQFAAPSMASAAAEQNGDGDNDLDDDDQVEDGGANNGGSANGGGRQRKKRRRELVVKNATFMEGVPGVVLVTDQHRLSELQQKVQNMVGWQRNGFPGAQPVSMDCKNIKILHEFPYRVSWKADGTRYMMLINKRNEIYFFDRNNSCFQVENLSFVKSNNLTEHLDNTLLDGEMVLDKFQGKTIPRYLVYDIVKLCNKAIGAEPFYPNRLACIKKEIIDPRVAAMQKGIINRPQEPFSVRNKDFWEIDRAESLLGEKFAKALSHEPDGLIFQPSLPQYTPGPCPNVLKWKPSDMNSVDFRIKIIKENRPGMLPSKVGQLYVGGHDVPFSEIKYTKALREMDNKIIECTLNQQRQWEFMRERTDKVLPNSYDTAIAVCDSIRFPVTRDYLLDFIKDYGFRDKPDLMPPPKAQSHKERPPTSAAPPPPKHQHQQQHYHRQQHHQQQSQQQQQLQYRQPPAAIQTYEEKRQLSELDEEEEEPQH